MQKSNVQKIDQDDCKRFYGFTKELCYSGQGNASKKIGIHRTNLKKIQQFNISNISSFASI